MKNTYYKAGDKAVAINYKVGSSTMARAIISAFQPEFEALITTPHGDGNGTAYPTGKTADDFLWHGAAEKVPAEDVKLAYLLVREPVEKFRSACQMSRVESVDDKLAVLEAGDNRDGHFFTQARFLETPCKLYKFPEQLDDMAADVGLSLPLPVINESGHLVPGEKPTLSDAQIARVKAIYADDVRLFNTITSAGILSDSLPTEEELSAATVLGAHAATAAAFNSLSAGKQALLEPVRAAVERAIMESDFAKAKDIIATMPSLYAGMDADRAMFLALFQ